MRIPNVGDTVALKSDVEEHEEDATLMTVVGRDCNMLDVVWMNPDCQLQRAKLPTKALIVRKEERLLH